MLEHGSSVNYMQLVDVVRLPMGLAMEIGYGIAAGSDYCNQLNKVLSLIDILKEII